MADYSKGIYTRLKDKAAVTRILEPVDIMFSEFYFYLVAYITDESENLGELHQLALHGSFHLLFDL